MNFPTPSAGHVNCRYCYQLNVPGCVRCGRCAHNCGCCCKQCRNCLRQHAAGRSGRTFCRVCSRCERPTAPGGGDSAYRCTCKSRPRHQPINPAPLRTFRSIRLRRAVGLEIELSKVGLDADTLRYVCPITFTWVHDGSITTGGMEMVTQPLQGQQLVDGLTWLSEKFAERHCEADDSCGYHVHVGAGDFGMYELRRLLLLYHRFEDVFYGLCKEGRDKTRLVRGEPKCYCKRLSWKGAWYEHLMRLQRGKDIKRYLIQTLYPDWVRGLGAPQGRIDMRGIRRHKYEACRYFGLNLHTWFERGTVEYRHHEGTLERDRLLNWALWCMWFTEFASRLTDTQVAECRTLDDLLHREWPTGDGVLRMPSGVVSYVLRTREEKQKAQAKAATVPF